MKRGFSLVELSIVLVILGLLVGGILAGQSLIRAAELKGVLRDVRKYSTAVAAFQDKYRGLPGDLVNATSFWTSGTVNGNADSYINGPQNDLTGDYLSKYEGPLAWQHLALAGLVEGQFTGGYGSTAGSNSGSLQPGVNVPRSSYPNTGFMFVTNRQSGLWALVSGGMQSNELWGNSWQVGDIYSLDIKNDDGMPNLGRIRATNSAGAANICVDSPILPAAVYMLSHETTIECRATFMSGAG